MLHQHSGLIDSSALSSLPIHPIPIYEIIFNIFLVFLLIKIRNKFKTNGAQFRFYIFGYCTFRFFEEFLRADTGLGTILTLKPIQINLILSVIWTLYWIYKNELKDRINYLK